jgi:hypothetical protein
MECNLAMTLTDRNLRHQPRKETEAVFGPSDEGRSTAHIQLCEQAHRVVECKRRSSAHVHVTSWLQTSRSTSHSTTESMPPTRRRLVEVDSRKALAMTCLRIAALRIQRPGRLRHVKQRRSARWRTQARNS